MALRAFKSSGRFVVVVQLFIKNFLVATEVAQEGKIGTSGFKPRNVAAFVMLIWQVAHSPTWFFFSPPPSCLNFIEIRVCNSGAPSL
jgi:hypothetical protein